MLDDLLVGDTGLVPFGREVATHALMGRFGNVLLVNGREDWRFEARPGQTVRLYLTNAANARTFNVSLGECLTAGRGGRCRLLCPARVRSKAW